ncbi:MAG: hypothetical protein ACUVR1_01645 [Fimbriimonadales bacterium]
MFQREIPLGVFIGLIVALVLMAGVMLYRAWTGGIQRYGTGGAKPAPGVPGENVPGPPGGNPLGIGSAPDSPR